MNPRCLTPRSRFWAPIGAVGNDLLPIPKLVRPILTDLLAPTLPISGSLFRPTRSTRHTTSREHAFQMYPRFRPSPFSSCGAEGPPCSTTAWTTKQTSSCNRESCPCSRGSLHAIGRIMDRRELRTTCRNAVRRRCRADSAPHGTVSRRIHPIVACLSSGQLASDHEVAHLHIALPLVCPPSPHKPSQVHLAFRPVRSQHHRRQRRNLSRNMANSQHMRASHPWFRAIWDAFDNRGQGST